MTIKEIRRRATVLGVNLKGQDKTEMIRAIQAAEKNPQCFQTGRTSCPETRCCWMDDCIPSQAAVRNR